MSRLVNVIAKIIGLCLIGCCLCFDWQMSNWRIAIGKGLISGRQIGKWHLIENLCVFGGEMKQQSCA